MTQDTFAELYDDTCCAVYGTALAVVHDRTVAAEIVRDVYLAAWGSVDPAARSAPALRASARRLATEQVRQMSTSERYAVGEASLEKAWRHCSGESRGALPPARGCLVLALALRHGTDHRLVGELLGVDVAEVDRLLVSELRAGAD